jgi:hypothetical protein
MARNLLRCFARPFGQALHFLGNDREAAPRFARRSGLDGGIEGEDVGLLGDVRDQLDDLADFLGRFTQPLDPLRGFLDLLTDLVHALDRVCTA